MAFKDSIRAARHQAQLSQAVVAQRAGIDQSQYSRIEAGSVTTPTTARAICRVLGLGPPHPATAFLESLAADLATNTGLSRDEAIRELREDLGLGMAGFEATRQTFYDAGGTDEQIAAIEATVQQRAQRNGVSLNEAAIAVADYLRLKPEGIDAATADYIDPRLRHGYEPPNTELRIGHLR